ncbi:putative adipose-regulatory protein-domain-containing protein, partial [Triangularia verruculosa]
MSKEKPLPSPDDDDDDDDFALLTHQWTQITSGLRALVTETKNGIYYLLTSRTFQKSLISSVLVLTAGVVLYLFAAVAYIGFYYTYLPKLVHEQEVFLHYGYGQNPLAITPITLLPSQPYDISLSLTLPLTPENTKRGNFMVVIHLLDTEYPPPSPQSLPSDQSKVLYNPQIQINKSTGQTDLVTVLSLPSLLTPSSILLTSARPVILPYTDPLVSLAKRILFLPYHVLFTQRAEATTLTTKLLSQVSFGSRRAKDGKGILPKSMVVEIQAGQGLRVYDCKVSVVAQLRGLRWVMYRYRIFSFLTITTVFWAVEMIALVVAAVFISSWINGSSPPDVDREKRRGIEGWIPPPQSQAQVIMKREEDGDMSDTERTFPTGRGEVPLRYESESGVGGTMTTKV